MATLVEVVESEARRIASLRDSLSQAVLASGFESVHFSPAALRCLAVVAFDDARLSALATDLAVAKVAGAAAVLFDAVFSGTDAAMTLTPLFPAAPGDAACPSTLSASDPSDDADEPSSTRPKGKTLH